MFRVFLSVRRLTLLILVLLAGPVVAAAGGLARVDGDWRTASRESAGIAPDPAVVTGPVVQVYGARAFSWRGAFAVHSWIAVKRAGAPTFKTYQVTGWRYWHGGSPLSVSEGPPDRKWFGASPEIYADLRGPEAESAIDKIEAAVAAYPFKDSYRTWPGPNSNTFTAAIARAVPELGLDLPPTAIGKDYLGATAFAARAPSGTGFQVSILGVLGLTVGLKEGLEINLLGLSFGLDPLGLAVKLPGIGRLGMERAP